MKHTIITLLMLIAASVTAMAQGDDNNITVSGRVTDAATGEPLAGVRVEAYGNNRFTAMTDDKGEYELKVPAWVSSVLMKVDGYNVQQTAIGREVDRVDARLYTTAFGASYKARTTARLDKTVSAPDNADDLSVDPTISRRLGADVHSLSRGGKPGMGNAMYIGGLNSLQSNAQPLVVIDGVITDMQYGRTMLHEGYYNNLFSNINLEDVENITVLKNGTALYGAKGANGVILINTKRNKSMATRIDVNIGAGFQLMPRLPKMMGAEDYRLYATELLSNQVPDVGRLEFVNTDPTYYYYPQYHNQTDWTDEVYRTAWTQNYGINVQGGDDVASYNLSVGYTKSNSTLKENNFSRFNMRLNTDINIIRNLSVRFDAAYSDVDRKLRDDGLAATLDDFTVTSPSALALIKSPFLSPYAVDTQGRLSSFLAEADGYLPLPDVSLANPRSILDLGDGENRNSFGNRMVVISVTPKYQFNQHLSLSEHFNFSLINTNENYYLPVQGTPRFRIKSLSTEYQNNLAQSLAARQNSIQSDTRINWRNRYAAHSIDVVGGLRYASSDYKLTMQRGFNTPNDKSPNVTGDLKLKQTSGADDKVREFTWYGQADYNYAERYYLSAGLSMHTSSRFGKEADGLKLAGVVWGLFPSVQASWVMTNEKWLADVRPLNYLRLNLGYDVTGNDDIDFTASRTYLVANNMFAGQIDGKSLGNIGNTELRWETTRRLTAGFDANLIDNRLSLQFNFYKSWTSNLLTLRQLAWTSGLKENWSNDGKLENVGFDVTATARVLNLKDWKWELGASMGHYKNKVSQLPAGTPSMETTISGATVRTEVGQPVALFYGYRSLGVFATQAEADAAQLSVVDENNVSHAFQAGDIHFADLDGNHIIDSRDREVIGDPNPDIYGNIFTALSWKRFRLDAVFNYSLGNDIFNYQRSVLEGGNRFFNQTTALNGRWTTEGQRTDIPRASYQDPMGNSRFSDRWIEDGSFLRLSNVTLSYALPIQSTYLQGITVWASADNLFTITRYLGSDPAAIASGNVRALGIDRGLLGQGRSFAMGVKINL